MERGIKIVLAILFFICLARMPYGYFQFVRFTAMIGFVVLSYQLMQRGRWSGAMIYMALALLYQPIWKVSLGRTMWNVVDVVLGIYLLVSAFAETGDDKQEKG
jgi:hypothetical protein